MSSGGESASNVDIDEYEDFYDMLQINRNMPPEQTKRICRKLLARYHPDVSDHDNAREIYKKINKAKDILGDKKQRAIYNELGHDKYMHEREESGKRELEGRYIKDTVNRGMERNSQEDIEQMQTDQSQSDSSGSETTDTTESEDESQSQQDVEESEVDTSTEDGSERTSEYLLTDVESKAGIQQIYKSSWVIRAITVPILTLIMVYVGGTQSQVLNDLTSSYSSVIGVGDIILVATIIASISIGSTVAYLAHRSIWKIDPPIEYDETDFVEVEENEESNTRGTRNETGRNISSHAVEDTRSKWDDSDQYREKEESVRRIIRYNWSLRNGVLLLLTGVGLSSLFGLIPGVHPLRYVYSVISGGEDVLVMNPGETSISALIALLNGSVTFVLMSLLVGGAIFTIHGVSKEAWYIKYFTDADIHVVLWDTLVFVIGVLFPLSLLIGGTELRILSGVSVPPVAVSAVVITEKVSYLSVLSVSFVMLLLIAIVFSYIHNGTLISPKKGK